MRIPTRRSEKNVDRSIDPYLTRDGIAALERDLERLQKRSRPRVLAELQAAQALGDLSENAAYSIAKGRLRGIDARVAEITERLKRAVLIAPGSPDGTVQIGSRVTVRVGGAERVYDIVGSQETDPSAGRISYLSPLGALLIGHTAGDVIELPVDDRRVRYEIVAVR